MNGIRKQELERCEEVIARGLRTFIEVGEALRRIRDERLYRCHYGTFEAYCKERWGWGRAQAYRQIEAAETVALLNPQSTREGLSPNGDILPHSVLKNEAQARAIAPLARQDAEAAREALHEVYEERGGAATAKDVARVVENYRAKGTGDTEWWTPEDVLDDVRAVLGEIELDPASSEAAQEFVRAENYLTREQDALKQEWCGKVFLNPPYSHPAIANFAQKLLEEYRSCRVEEAILLTHNYTDTAWFHAAASESTLLCFTRGRIRFVCPKVGVMGAPTQGQTFFYYGREPEAFRRTFERRGLVVTAWTRQEQTAASPGATPKQ